MEKKFKAEDLIPFVRISPGDANPIKGTPFMTDGPFCFAGAYLGAKVSGDTRKLFFYIDFDLCPECKRWSKEKLVKLELLDSVNEVVEKFETMEFI